jgi:hypothetical protein
MGYEVTQNKNGRYNLKIDGKQFGFNGRTEFKYLHKFKDNSITLNLDDCSSFLVESDGTLFRYDGLTMFQGIQRQLDGSTKIKTFNEYILIEPDGTLFKYDGIAEFGTERLFHDIKRFDDGRTKIVIQKTIIVEKGEQK